MGRHAVGEAPRTIAFVVPGALAELMEAQAAADNVTLSKWTRDAIESHLALLEEMHR